MISWENGRILIECKEAHQVFSPWNLKLNRLKIRARKIIRNINLYTPLPQSLQKPQTETTSYNQFKFLEMTILTSKEVEFNEFHVISFEMLNKTLGTYIHFPFSKHHRYILCHSIHFTHIHTHTYINISNEFHVIWFEMLSKTLGTYKFWSFFKASSIHHISFNTFYTYTYTHIYMEIYIFYKQRT